MTGFQRSIAGGIGRVPVSGLPRFFGIAASMPDAIFLSVGETDFSTPAPIAEAGSKAIYKKPIGYTTNSDLIELREAIAAYLELCGKI